MTFVNATHRKDLRNWLSPLGLIPWSSQALEGNIIALSDGALKLSSSDTRGRLGFFQLDLRWEQSVFTLRGMLEAAHDSEQVFVINEEDTRKLHDLLNSLRKSHHLSICQTQDVEASDRFTGFSEFSFIPEAVPDLNWDDVCLEAKFLKKTFKAPLLITGMTGGIERGQDLNHRLAKVAEHFGIPMGIGSQRMALENKEYRKIFTVKNYAPNVFLIGNLGGSQLLGSNAVELCKEAVSMVEADALAIHVNVIQECVQAEGSPNFRGLWKSLEAVCKALDIPVIVKEVGCGISPQTARRLMDVGVSAIDCGGRGGTSWGYIEGLRTLSEQTRSLAESFRDWGIPTAYSLKAIRSELPHAPLIATGGIRDGLSVAKALALGANMVGIGLPLMRAANESEDKVHAVLANVIKGLQTAMLATGSERIEDLRSKIVRGQPFGEI